MVTVTPLSRPTATVVVDDHTLSASDGDVSLDAGKVPYAQARLDIPLTSADVAEALDPRDDLRALVTAGDAIAGTSRPFDLTVRSRVVDHRQKRVTLGLASDEALLMDYAPIIQDVGAFAYQSSMRGVIDYVLTKIGAELAPGDVDADVTPYWAVSNAVGNPSFTVDTSQWISATFNSTLDRSGSAGYIGVGRARCTASGTGVVGLHWGTTTGGLTYIQSATPGRTYTASMYLLSSVAKNAYIGIRFTDGTTYTDVTTIATPTALNTSTWTRLTITATCPAGKSGVSFYAIGQAYTSGQIMYADNAMLHEGDVVVPYFDGDTADDGAYTYEWAGDADASASSRTPLIDRPREMLIWEPGVTAWDFLAPITATAGLRLFCDELRVWRLINPATYSVPGVVAIAGYNATEGIDRVDLEDQNANCTGVVVMYRWQDPDKIERRATDAAGEPGRVLRFEYDRPYPGPGAAAAILARRQGAGRVQDVTALTDWTVTPSSEASITLPATVQQIGTLRSVRWDIKSGLMRVGTSGLLDAVPGSWLAWDPDEAWEDVDAGTEWEDL